MQLLMKIQNQVTLRFYKPISIGYTTNLEQSETNYDNYTIGIITGISGNQSWYITKNSKGFLNLNTEGSSEYTDL